MLESIEKNIKSLPDKLRYAFISEQVSHSYINLFTEWYKEHNVPHAQRCGQVTGILLALVPGFVIVLTLYYLKKYSEELK